MALNHIYKVVWSKTKGCYIVVSELAKRVGRNKAKAIVISSAAMAMAVSPILTSTVGATLNATGTGDNSGVAWGDNSQGTGSAAVAVGKDAKATGKQSVALGNNSKAEADYSYAIGWASEATKIRSIAIGYSAKASHNNSLALGWNSKALGPTSVALGAGSTAQGDDSYAIGMNSKAIGNLTMAFGNASKANKTYDIAIGKEAETRDQGSGYSIAIGYGAMSGTDKGGKSLNGNDAGGVAIGTGAYTGINKNTTAINSAVAVGAGAGAGYRKVDADGLPVDNGTDADNNAAVLVKAFGGTTGHLGYFKNAGNANKEGFFSFQNVNINEGTALGRNARAIGDQSVAIGAQSVAGQGSIVIGGNDIQAYDKKKYFKAADPNSKEAQSVNDFDAAVTPGTGKKNPKDTVLSELTITEKYQELVGEKLDNTYRSSYGQDGSTVIGMQAHSTTPLGVAIGTNSIVRKGAFGATAIGSGASVFANAEAAVAIGMGSQAQGNYAVAAGTAAKAKESAVAAGYSANAEESAVAVGDHSKAVKASVAVGQLAKAENIADIAVGQGAVASGEQGAIAMGLGTQAQGDSSIMIGGSEITKVAAQTVNYQKEKKDGKGHAVIKTTKKKEQINGEEVERTIRSVEMEAATGTIQDAYGELTNGATLNTATLDYSLATNKNGHGSISMGIHSLSTGDLGTAIGTGARVAKLGGVALGTGAISELQNGVAIGTGSRADANSIGTRQTDISYDEEGRVVPFDSKKVAYTFYWAGGTNTSEGDVVSFGTPGAERQLKNVAAGRIADDSTDAINGSQLNSVTKRMSSGWSVEGEKDHGSSGVLKLKGTEATGKSVNYAADGKSFTNGEVGTATGKVDKVRLNDEVKIRVGDNLVLNQEDASRPVYEDPDNKNRQTGTRITSKFTYSLNPVLTNLKSATFKNDAGDTTVINGAGVTVTPVTTGKQPVSLTTSGLNNGGNAISNVASNLPDTKNNTATKGASNATKSQEAPTLGTGTNEVNPTNAATVGDVLNAGWNLQGNNAAVDFVKPYDTVNFINGDGTTASVTSTDGKTSTVKYSVNLGDGLEKDTNNKITVKASDKSVTVGADGVKVNPGNKSLKTTEDGLIVNTADKSLEVTNNGLKVKTDGKTITTDNTDGLKVVTGEIEPVKTGADPGTYTGTVKVKDNDAGKIATVDSVVSAVNSAAWTATSGSAGTGTVTGTTAELIKAGNTVTFKAGDNLAIKQAGKEFIYSLNPALSGLTSAEFKDSKNNTVNITPTGITITKPADTTTNTPAKTVKLNQDGLDNGGNTITNVKSGLDTYGGNVPGTTDKNTGLVNLSKPTAGEPKVSDNTAATVGDIRNMGWIVSSNKTTGENGAVTAAEYSATVKNTNEVKFVGEGSAIVSGKTDGDVRTITVKVDDQTSTNNAVTPVVYTDENGNQVYPTGKKDDDGNQIFNTKPDGSGTKVTGSVKTTVNGPKGTSTPTTLSNVEGNLVGAKTGTDAPTTSATAPTLGTGTNQVNKNNVATVGDVLQAGWNLQGDGTAVDFVKPYDTVNFVKGDGTSVTVESADGKTSTVKYSVNLGNGLQKDTTGNTISVKPADKSLAVGTDGVKVNPGDKSLETTTAGLTVKKADSSLETTTDGLKVKTDGTTITTDNTNGLKVVTGDIEPVTTGTTAGTVKVKDNDAGKIATVDTVAKAVNDAAFTLKASATTGGTRNADSGVDAAGESIKAGSTVEMIAGKNLDVKHDASGKITFATVENPSFSTVQVGGDKGPKLAKADDGSIKVSDKDGAKPVKITNVKAGDVTDTSTDAINGSQFHAVAKNTIKLAGQNGTAAATETDEQSLDKTGGIKFTVKSSDGALLDVAAAGDTITLTPKTGTITTGTDGVPTATTTGGKLVTADQLVTALTKMGWKATAGQDDDGTVTDATVELIKAGDTVTFKAGNNLAVKQAGKNFTYSLQKELTGLTSAKFKDDDNNTVNITPTGITITKPADATGANGKTVTLNQDGLNNGGNAISNVASNLPNTQNSTTANTVTDPSNATKSQTAPNTTNKTGDNYVNPNNATTVGDVLNAGWNLQGNGADVDFVKPYDTVNFVDGDGTTASVTSTDGKTSTVKYSVNLGNGLQKDTTGNTISVKPSDKSLAVGADGVKVNPGDESLETTTAGLTVKKADASLETTTNGLKVKTDGTTITTDGTNGLKVVTGTINKVETGNKAGTVESKTGDENKIATVGNVVDAINNAAWTATSAATTAGELGATAKNQLVKAGDKVTFEADKNIKITQTGSKFTFTTKDNVSFTTVQVGGDQGPKLAKADDGDLKVSGPNGTDPVKVTNVKSGLDTYGDNVPGTNDKNRGLVDLSKPESGQPKVSDNTAATVGDIRNMGWIVSSNKTTGANGAVTTAEYSATVKNANEVRFVGTGSAIVSGKTENGVRTITVDVDNQVATNKSVTPVNYTKKDGTKVYPQEITNTDGTKTVKFYTEPDGKGTEVADSEVITSVNGPKGTTSPTTLSNVEGNLVGAKTGTDAPTTSATAPTLGTGTNQVNKNNAATVGDVLNAGWNLQGNGAAVDFVKPYDTVNFVNGLNTTAVVSTVDGKTSNVTYNVTGLPITYTDKDGNPVSKIGDKYYKVNDKGQPLDANGNPSTKVNNEGKPVDDDGNVIDPIDTTNNPVKTSLVNPTPETGKTGTSSPTTLDNVTSKLTNYNGAPVNGKEPVKNGLRDLTNTNVTDNTVATVGDIRNMGWVVSSNKTTGANGAVTTDEYSDTVKNANEVKFVGEGSAIVSGKTEGNVRTITVKVDNQTGLNKTVTPVNYTKADGTKVYPQEITNPDGSKTVKFFENPDGSGNEIPANQVITSVNGPEGTTNPTTLSNVKSNLPDTQNSTTANTEADPSNATKSQVAPTLGTGANEVNKNNAATVGDVLNAGWNLQGNGVAKDFVKPYDTVNFVNGDGTTATVESADGKTSTVKYSVNLGNGLEKDANNKIAVKAADTSLEVGTDGLKVKTDGTTITTDATKGLKVVTGTINNVTTGDTAGTVEAKTGDGDKIATVGNVVDAINNAAWTATSAKTDSGELGATAKNQLIKAGDKVTFEADKNIKITQDGSKFTFTTKDNVSFTTVQVGGDQGPKLAKADDGSIKVSDKDGTNPVAITNVKSNLPETQNSNKANTAADPSNATKSQTAPTLGTGINQVNPNNAATVGDVLNAGWNLQGNGTAVDFVKPYDTVNFVNGLNTTAVVSTVDGKTSNVTYNVTGLPITYTDKDGNPVSKIGDNFYKVNDKGQPLDANGNPSTKVNNDGNPVDDAGNVINPIDTTNNPIKTSLVNPSPAAGKTGTSSPTTLDNVTSKLTNYNDPTVDGKTPVRNGLVDLSKPTAGQPKVSDNTVATVGDLRNMGWIVSSDKNTDDLTKDYSDTVKNANEVKFVGEGTAIVSGKTDGNVRTITVKVDDQTSTNNAVTPVAYTKADGTQVYPTNKKDTQGNPIFNTKADGSGDEVPNTEVITSVNGPKGTTTPTTLSNVEGNLDGAKTNTTAPTTNHVGVNTTTPTAANYVNPHNAATVGDVLQAGWNLQNNGAAKDFVKPYDTVNFVNGLNTTAVVTTSDDGTTSNVTYNVTGLPVTYTTADGTPVSKIGDKYYKVNDQGQPVDATGNPVTKFNQDGVPVDAAGQPIPEVNITTNPLRTSVVNPKADTGKTGTTTPTTLSNIKSNLPDTKNNDATTGPSNATTAQAAPNTTNKTGNDYVNPNNAATVGDVLNAGWNLQGNGVAKDFVKPYDTVNFVNGLNTTAVVSTVDGKTSNVTYNVTGLPITYTDKDGNPVSKIGDNFYKVNDKGQPLDANGNPSTKVNNDGKPVDDAGNVINPIDTTNNPVKTSLVNPTPETGKTGTSSPTTLDNVTSKLTNYNGAPVNGKDPVKNGLRDLTNTNVTDNTVATVGDLRNMGWIVSSDKTTDALTTAYSDTVKNANEVKFVGEGTAIVSGKTDGNVRTITVKVDDQTSTNNAVTPVAYTKADGTQVYPTNKKDTQGNPIFNTKADGSGDEVPNTEVITSVNGPKGTTTPTTLSNVEGNLDGAKSNTTAPTTNAGAPNTTNAAQPNYVNPHNAATVGDVLSAGWNLQGNGVAKDFVKPYDTVNFVNGINTTAVVTTSDDGTTSNVTYNVTGLPVTYTTADGTPVSKIGDKYYKVNDQGQPVDANGNPVTKFNKNGVPVDAAGQPIPDLDITTNPLITSVVNPKSDTGKTGTTTPTTLSNVEGNLDGAKTGTQAPTDKHDAPNTTNAAQPNYVNTHNAATVGDVLQAGWNLQNNGTAKDFVKPYDTVNFVNGGNTTAVVTTNAEGTASNVTFNVTGLPVATTISTNNGPVHLTKVGDNYYPVKGDGTPDIQTGADGHPTNGYVKANDGNYYPAGDVTYNTDPATNVTTITPNANATPAKFGNTLTNPNVSNTDAAPNNSVSSPTSLGNVKNNLDSVNDGTEVITKPDGTVVNKKPNKENITKGSITAEEAAKLANPKLADGSTNPNYVGNNAATVSDVLNAGFNVQGNGKAVDFVKPYDTVNFRDGGNTTVSVTTDDNLTTHVQVNVTGLPVTNTITDGNGKEVPVVKVGNTFYPANADGTPNIVRDATGNPTNGYVQANDGKVYPRADVDITNNADGTTTVVPKAGKTPTTVNTNVVNPNVANTDTNPGNTVNTPTTVGNVTSGLHKYGDTVNGNTVPGTTTANTGLLDLSTPTDGTKPKVSDNTVATVGDLRNMGWIVSSDKTTKDLTKAYSDTVKNANEVKFVGEGTAIVSGKTDGNVRTITVKVDDQTSTNNSVTPVNYTTADGTKVYPKTVTDPVTGTTEVKFYKNPDGTGDEVQKGDVITSINGPEGTTSPTTLKNVKNNIPNVNDGTQEITKPDGSVVTKAPDQANINKAPLTAAEAAELSNPKTVDGAANPKYIGNNAATVSDVLNAGWNLQGNGVAKDFVKPYDTVNFVNGGNTTAVVTTNAEGTASNVTFNVTGLPMTYTTADGTPVSKIGDKYYKVNDKGQPVDANGKASTKVDANGQPLDENGTVIQPIDTATNPLHSTLVNPNVSNSDAEPNKQTTSPTQLGNVTSGLHKYGDTVDGKPVEGTTPGNTGLIDLSKPTTGNPKVSDNTAATVGDLRNMGWIVSSDKTTNDDGTAGGTNYTDQVRNANEVKFVGKGTAIVSGKTVNGVRTITVKVDDQVSTNNAIMPTSFTTKDGKKVYPVKDDAGNVTYHTTPDGKGTGDTTIDPSNVVTSVNGPGPNGTTTPTTLQNVKSNLPNVDDKKQKAFNPDGTEVTEAGTTTNTGNAKAPLSHTVVAEMMSPYMTNDKGEFIDANGNVTTDPTKYVRNPNFAANNAATVGDVLQAGWNLQNNGTAKDFVKPYDTVNFINGLGTTAVVTTREGNTTSDVTFNVKAANSSVTVDEDGVKVTTGEITSNTNGSVTGPTDPATAKQLKDTLDAAVKELATAKDALKAAETALAANPKDPALQQAVADKKADVAAKQTPVDAAQKAHDDAGLNKIATVQNVAEAINNAGFNLKTSADGGEKLTTGTKNDGELIKPGNTVEMVAGNNLTVKQDANGKITYATKDNVTFTHVDTGTLNVGSPNTFTDGKGNTYTKVGNDYYNPSDVENGAPKTGATAVTIPADAVMKPVSPVTMKAEAAKPATNNGTDAQPSSALNITSKDGKPTQITGVGSTLNTKSVDTTPSGTTPGATPNTTAVNLVDLEGTTNAPVNKNAAATVGDLQNMGWVVSAKDGNGYKDVVKNANVVDFKGGKGIEITGNTLADGTREITVGIKEGEVTNKVTITHGDGTKTDAVKIGDNYYKVDKDGKPIGFDKDENGKPAGTPLTIDPTKDKVTNNGAGFVTGNTVANAIQDSGWNIGKANISDVKKSDGTAVDFNKEAKVYDTVNPNDDVKFVDGANANVSMVTVDALNKDGTKKATTFVKVDVNRDLKIDSLTTGGTVVDKNGNNLVKVGDDYYKESDIDPVTKQPKANAKPVPPAKDGKDLVKVGDKYYEAGDVTVVTNPDGSTTATPKANAKPVSPAKDGEMIVKNADGKDVVSATVGKDGSGVFGVNGKDGKDGVSITAKDGEGAIGVNGKDGKNTSITGDSISIKDKDNKNSTEIGINSVTLKDKDGNTSTLTADKSELIDKDGNTNTSTSTTITLADKDKNTNTSTAAGTTYTDKDKNTTTVGPKEIVLRDKDGNNTSKLTNNDLLLNTKDPNTGVEKTSHMSGDKIAFTTTDEIEKDSKGNPVIDPKTNQPKIKNPGNSTEYTNEGLKVIPNSTVARDANGNPTFLDKTGKPVMKDTDGKYKYVGQDGKPGKEYTGGSGSLKPNVVDTTRVISFGMDKPVLDANGNPVKGPDGKTVMTEGISAGMQQIHNVAPGTKDTDAVNVSQLKGMGNVVMNVNNRVNRVGAQAAALAGLQSLQYDPLEPTQISAGLGYYKGSGALALGVNHFKNESTMFHMGASFNGHGDETMMNASVTWKFGARADETAVKDTFRQGPISASYTLQDKVSALEAQNQIQKDQLNELRATNAAQKAENEAQREELALMKAQIAELFKRMNG